MSGRISFIQSRGVVFINEKPDQETRQRKKVKNLSILIDF